MDDTTDFLNMDSLSQRGFLDSEKQLSLLSKETEVIDTLDTFRYKFNRILFDFIRSSPFKHTEFHNQSSKDVFQFIFRLNKHQLYLMVTKKGQSISYQYSFNTAILLKNKKELPFERYKPFVSLLSRVMSLISKGQSLCRMMD